MQSEKILILGANGMLGHTLFYYFINHKKDVWATLRNKKNLHQTFSEAMQKRIFLDVDVAQLKGIEKVIAELSPTLVINCIGIIKQLPSAKDSITSIQINALLPHQLAEICKKVKARLIQISTDCVFSGDKGNYKEEDFSDAHDLYGRTKYLGELDYEHTLTLRTSIIGHELKEHKVSLIDWFLSQEGSINGFKKALYTGFPTIEIARIIDEYVLKNPNLHGLYHVSSDVISKYDLLNLVKDVYKKNIEIKEEENFVIDRSLNSKRFQKATGYNPPSWDELIKRMYQDYKSRKEIY